MNLRFLFVMGLTILLAGVQTANGQSVVKDSCDAEGVRHIVAKPEGVCSVQIDIALKGNIVEEVIYTRGCNGNAKGLNALIKGMSVEEAISRLEGITCGNKPTSCPDQLARVLKMLKFPEATKHDCKGCDKHCAK